MTTPAADPAVRAGAREPLHARLLKALPDARAWMAGGLFVLAWRVLGMIAANPALLANSSFMVIVGLIIGGGGLGLANAFFFGGTKAGSEVMTSQAKAKEAGQ